MVLECRVSDIMAIKVPKVYRLKGTCNDVEVEVEFHEDVVEAPKKDSKFVVEITSSKDECLKHYFCAQGYVVSNTRLGDAYRVVISLHGFLAVIKGKQKVDLNVMEQVYLGVSFSR